MLSFLLLPVVALASVVSAQTGALTINTPGSVVQCQKTLLTWSGGEPPYYVSILPGRSLANPYESIFPTNDLSYSWNCDIGTNTTLTFGIKDSTGAINFSGVTVVGASSDTACIGQNAVIEASVALTRTSTPTPAGGASATASNTAGGSATSAAASSAAAQTTAASTGGAANVAGTNNVLALSVSALVVLGGAALVGL